MVIATVPLECESPLFCRKCGDRLVHQSWRGPHDASSALGQFAHDNLPREMDWIDTDALIHRLSRGALRFLEWKLPGQSLSKSQERVLPILSTALKLAEQQGLIREADVLVLWSEPPFRRGVIRLVEPEIPLRLTPALGLDEHELRLLLLGLRVPSLWFLK